METHTYRAGLRMRGHEQTETQVYSGELGVETLDGGYDDNSRLAGSCSLAATSGPGRPSKVRKTNPFAPLPHRPHPPPQRPHTRVGAAASAALVAAASGGSGRRRFATTGQGADVEQAARGLETKGEYPHTGVKELQGHRPK